MGTVKVYKTDKGFGFVGQDGGGKDVFVHATALARAGLSGLVEGQRVRMKIGQGQKGLEAQTIELLDYDAVRQVSLSPLYLQAAVRYLVKTLTPLRAVAHIRGARRSSVKCPVPIACRGPRCRRTHRGLDYRDGSTAQRGCNALLKVSLELSKLDEFAHRHSLPRKPSSVSVKRITSEAYLHSE